MNKILSVLKKLYFPVLAIVLAMPIKASALSINLGGGSGGGARSGLDEIEGEFDQGMFSGVDTIPEMIAVVIRILLMIGGAIAVLFVIIGGYQYLTSGGNDEDAEKGKKTLVNAIIGIIIILLAWVIVSVVVNQITD